MSAEYFASANAKNRRRANSVYVANTIFLTECNHQTVSQSVIATLRDFSIAFNAVVSFYTNNASYMVKSILSPLYPMAIHITCIEHI